MHTDAEAPRLFPRGETLPAIPVRRLPPAQHHERERRACDHARRLCREDGGKPDRQISRSNEYPEFIEYYSDGLRLADAEMIAESQMGIAA
jgi:hypothetical protein